MQFSEVHRWGYKPRDHFWFQLRHPKGGSGPLCRFSSRQARSISQLLTDYVQDILRASGSTRSTAWREAAAARRDLAAPGCDRRLPSARRPARSDPVPRRRRAQAVHASGRPRCRRQTGHCEPGRFYRRVGSGWEVVRSERTRIGSAWTAGSSWRSSAERKTFACAHWARVRAPCGDGLAQRLLDAFKQCSAVALLRSLEAGDVRDGVASAS